MATFIELVSRLIYGSGAEAVLTPNHAQWIDDNPFPSGTAWIDRHVGATNSMLSVYEEWLRTSALPPIYPWDGASLSPWDPNDTANTVEFTGVPLPANLSPTSLSFASQDALGDALRRRFTSLMSTAGDLQQLVKAPYSHRFWGYLKWASLIVRRFHGELVDFAPPLLRDRDGTLLSAVPFLNFVNDAHWRWHDFDPALSHHALPLYDGGPYSPAGTATPGHTSPVGQRASALSQADSTFGHDRSNEEFLTFHREHVQMFHNWLARTGQPPQPSINMLSVVGATSSGDVGWPPAAAGNPSSWTPSTNLPWANSEAEEATRRSLLAFETRRALAGSAMGNYHARGHNANRDIRHPFMNNYVPRFFAWHGFLDDQWFFREPRFARWNPTTRLRERLFRPVTPAGAPWPGMSALTIVRDPAAPADTVSPAGAIAGLDLTSGAGTLRVQLVVKDTYSRRLTLTLSASAFNDAAGGAATETLPDRVVTVGPGGDLAQDTDLTFDFTFSTAFRSRDPGRTAPSAGFVNSRIRITGTLAVADGSDPGFVHEDHLDVDLVQEQQAPQVDLYLNLSSFGEAQVDAQPAETDGSKRFRSALIVTVQDRTERPAPIAWPALIQDELRGVLAPPVPAAGLLDEAVAQQLPILQPSADAEVSGVRFERASGPLKEDPSLPDNVPQRYTYLYDMVFAPGHAAFAGLAEGAERLARLRVRAADRAGNEATREVTVKLFRDANPFMIDGNPAWLSQDTRVLRVFEGEEVFGVTLAAGQPNQFLQDLLDRLNDPAVALATRDGWLDSLPVFSGQDVLEFATRIRTPATGADRAIYNFALARVRLRGTVAAPRVRAFFRLFTYSGSNLVYSASPSGLYRTHVDADRKVPLLGFNGAGEVVSIPFFAAPRVPYTQPMTRQEDGPNVFDFPPGSAGEQRRFFGAYLDINQDGARLPRARPSDPARADGAFTAAEVQPIRTLIRDAHECMVVEVVYDGDTTREGDTPFTSDNLAQRNLTILTSDNPGSPITRTVEHSFEADTRRHRLDRKQKGALALDAPTPVHLVAPAAQGGPSRLPVEAFGHGDEAHHVTEAHPHGAAAEHATHATHGIAAQATNAAQRAVLAFDAVDWKPTADVVDELMFVWNGLPEASRVELYLPGDRAEDVMNLRNVRHAPGDVRVVDEHTLLLAPRGVTFVPLPPSPAGRTAGVVTVVLPDGVRYGQSWQVDVIQLRGGERRGLGAFRIDIRVQKDLAGMAEAEARLLAVLFERRSLLPRHDPWRAILDRRVRTARARAEALAERAGLPFRDPTTWVDPGEPGVVRELAGMKLRVVLDRIEVRKDFDPWIKGKGEVAFFATVATRNNGTITRRTRLPDHGVLRVSDAPGHNVLRFDRVLFEGYAEDDLRIEIAGTEKDLVDPDDWMGKLVRVFSGPASAWFGEYGPLPGTITPEDAGPFRVYYRVERG